MESECGAKLKAWGAVRMEDRRERTAAIVLAAGQGRRMQSSIQKQYMLLQGKPLVYYALKEFEESAVDDVILVAGKGEVDYCREEIAERFGFHKIRKVVEGGKERYHSVYEGLKAIEGLEGTAAQCRTVLIHDGARPFITKEIIRSCMEGVAAYRACVVGMPVKDTIKIADDEQFARETPKRSSLWQIQTPQAFEYELIRTAYDKLFSKEEYQNGVTDDAMVVESMTDCRVKMIQGDYRNIKITTPEDMILAEAFLAERQKTC